MMTVSYDYGTLATEVYELDKPIGHSFGDVEYYTRLLAGTSGTILEPACGTGRILIPLTEAGWTVEGIDLSPEMLGACRQHCRDRGIEPVLREADMTTFTEPGRYSAVILPTGSIALLDGREPTAQALACWFRSLQPSGRLAVDLPPPGPVTGTGPMRHWRRGPVTWTLQTMQVDFDAAANQTTRWLRYDKWRDGELISSELQPFRLQHWSITEFRTLLAEAGFADVTVTADYQPARNPAPGSEIWTFQATRP
jgi:SAM-dependent methyltransferase